MPLRQKQRLIAILTGIGLVVLLMSTIIGAVVPGVVLLAEALI